MSKVYQIEYEFLDGKGCAECFSSVEEVNSKLSKLMFGSDGFPDSVKIKVLDDILDKSVKFTKPLYVSKGCHRKYPDDNKWVKIKYAAQYLAFTKIQEIVGNFKICKNEKQDEISKMFWFETFTQSNGHRIDKLHLSGIISWEYLT